jgi:hypothetical protein
VLDKADEAVSLSVPYVDMTKYLKLTDSQYDTIVAESRRRYCWEYAEPEREPEEPEPTQPPPRPGARPDPTDDTLYWTITVSPRIARKGGLHRLQVNRTPDERMTIAIKITPNTPHGPVRRLVGLGVFRRDGSRGDIMLTLRVPQRPDKQEEDDRGAQRLSYDADEIG